MTYLNREKNADPVYIIDGLTNQPVSFGGMFGGNSGGGDLDTSGNPVPTYKGHAYTYDDSGNLSTDTVTDGTNTWVRTYVTGSPARVSDSGWVKQ